MYSSGSPRCSQNTYLFSCSSFRQASSSMRERSNWFLMSKSLSSVRA